MTQSRTCLGLAVVAALAAMSAGSARAESRGNPAGIARRVPSWEGLGTLPGFPYQRRSPLDPFRAAGGAAPAPASQPVARLALATPAAAPARLELAAPASQPVARLALTAPASQPGAGSPGLRLRLAGGAGPTPPPPGAPPAGACRVEADCPASTYCEQEKCVPVEFRTNVLYLYYRSAGRSFTEVGGLYWHQRGKTGYRVVAPFYWHFWSPTDSFRAFAPFYWHAADHERSTESTVVPPVQWGSAPGERYFRFWPLVFHSDYGTQGSSFTLVPLLHVARRGTYSSVFTPLGGYGSDRATGEQRGLALLYYWHRAPGTRTDALWPLFYASSSPRRATVLALPLNFYWRRGASTHLVSIPFAYYGADRTSSLTLVPVPPVVSYRHRDWRMTTVFPLFWQWGTDRSRETWLLPLVFGGHTGERRHLVVFPLLWHFGRADGQTTVFANTWYHRDRTSYSAGIMPFAFFGADRQRGVSHATVLPLFHYSTEAHGRRRFLLTPLALHETDDDAGTSYTWALNYYRRRDPEREVDTVFPLYLRWHDRESGATTHAITPLVWLRRDPRGATHVLFPAVWRFTSARPKAAATFVLPIFFRHSAPHASTTVVATGYYHEDETGWDAGLAPLVFGGAGRAGRYAVLFPWLWHFSSAERSTTIAAPFYHVRDRRGWGAGLAPLVFAGNRDGESHFVLFPLLWRLASQKRGYDTTVVGPAYYSRTRDGYQAGLAPLVFFGRSARSEHQVVAPVFFRFFDRRTSDDLLVVGPVYHRTNGRGLRQIGLFPLFDSKTTRDTSRLTIVPLLHHQRRPGYDLWVTPLGGRLTEASRGRASSSTDDRRGRDTLVVGPYVHHRTRQVDAHVLAPLGAHWSNTADQSTATVVLPLGVYRRSPTETQGVLFPLLWYFRNPRETTLTVFPFYARRRSGQMNADVAFPLYWSFRSPEKETYVFGPGYLSRGVRKPSLHVGLLPLFIYGRDASGSALTALPLFHYSESAKERRSLLVAGPFIRAAYPDGHTTALLPLGFLRDRGPRRTGLLLPLVWHESDAEADAHTTVLGPFLYRRSGGTRTYGLLPLIFARSFPVGGAFTLFPALDVMSAPDRLRVLTPAAGVSWGKGAGTTWGYVGPLWWSRKQGYSADGLLPVVWRFHDHDAARQTLMIAPIWFSRTQPDSSLYAVLPLIWRARSIAGSTTVVLPVYFDVNRYYQERTTVVFPIGWRHASTVDQTSRWVSLPGVFVRSHTEGTDAFLFPLVWHWAGRERSTTVVAPLYWDFKRGTDRSSVFFPLVWRFGRADADHWVVVNTYVRTGKGKDEGTYRVVFIPLLEFGRPRPADLSWDVLGGLVGYSRIGRNRVLRLAWQDIWLTPLPARTPTRAATVAPALRAPPRARTATR